MRKLAESGHRLCYVQLTTHTGRYAKLANIVSFRKAPIRLPGRSDLPTSALQPMLTGRKTLELLGQIQARSR